MSWLLDRPRLVTEGAKPSDGVPDMTVISEIDEYGINENLKVRYHQNKIYTYTGTILVAVNPYKQLSVYKQEIVDAYKGKKMADMPPHIFATAEAALYFLERDNKNQSCVISGESGAGKSLCVGYPKAAAHVAVRSSVLTESTKFILQYLCTVTCSTTRWIEQQILEANVILEAFGNAKTVRNDNSSRFGKFIQVCFDNRNQISGSVIQDYLLEQSRLSFQARNERNYHVFYQLVAAAMKSPELKAQYMLEPAKTFHYINQSGCYTLQDVDDAESFNSLRLAMNVLNMSAEMLDGIFSVLSAILWIGNLSFADTDKETCKLTSNDQKIVPKIAKLLGITEEQTARICTIRQINVKGNITSIGLKLNEARDNRHSITKALYSRTFTWLVQQINSCTNPGADRSRFIGVLDIFGFEDFDTNSFEQLCINYTNEKLHKFFNHYVFSLEQQSYAEEGIKYSHIKFTDNTVCLELIEKAPKCVLKLLDEECRFPKGSDTSFIEKQHHELGSHPNYIKGSDKRRWGVEFGVKHYAGTVVYTVKDFLEKNKDHQQDMMFDYMENSSIQFVKELTKYRHLLSVSMEMARKKARSATATTKGMPTVSETFRIQLAALVDLLANTTPWYVRCLKPNENKAANDYDDKLIVTQLRYSGMLDIVRIRKEGYPVHVRAKDFLEKYRCLAVKDPEPLPDNPKMAVRKILKSFNLPETEWQIGKTKVFLRNSVFDPLEEKRKALLTEKMIIIQKVWRGYVKRKAFVKLRNAAITIQKHLRGSRLRIAFLKKRKASIVIQSYYRGMKARDLAAALRKKREEEEAERRRLKRIEEEKQAKLRAEKSMEESYHAAQMELLTLAKLAEHKSKNTTTSSGEVDLDKMFDFLAEAPKPKPGTEKSFFAQITADLESMFHESQATMESVKSSKSTPAAAPSTPNISGEKLTRTQRRQRRIMKKLLGVEEEQARKGEEQFDPTAYPLLTFAEMYFNDFPKDTGTLKTLTWKKGNTPKNVISKEETLMFTPKGTIPTSMVHMHDPDNVNLACNIFKDLCKYLKGDMKQEQQLLTIQSTIAYGIERPELRDEIFCQIIRQVTENPKEDATLRGWHFMTLCILAFLPGRSFNKYLQAYFMGLTSNPIVGKYAHYSLTALRQTRISTRKLPPSSMEIASVQNLNPLICRFYFLDGKAKAMGVISSATASDVIKMLAEKIELKSTDGWALFEVNPEREHFIKGHEYIADILSQWEGDKRSSVQMTKYQTMSKLPTYTQALGGGDSRFVFRKRVFRKPKEIPEDPVEYHLMFAQAVHSVVKLDEYPVNESVALQLSGLLAQVLWGDFNPSLTSRYDEIEQLLSQRIIETNKTKTREDWKKAIAHAHEEYGSGKTEIQAKVWYLTSVKHYPLYGSTMFHVQYKGFWSYPNNLILAVDVQGIKFVNQKTNHIMADYKYEQLESVAVDIEDQAVTLNMYTNAPEEQKCFIFETKQKEDIANLIASYSPAHNNWQRVGEKKTKQVHVTDKDKYKLWDEVWACRKALVDHKMLRRPLDSSGGFLTTTLRRYNRMKIDRLQQDKQIKDFEKIYKQSYWSYSKGMLKQPLTVIEGAELEELAIKMFYSLQHHAGIATGDKGGFEADYEDAAAIVQIVIAKCIEKEALCNEFYLQLIKQTTDQPDPNSRINIQNWRFLCLICGVVVPRNKIILNYFQMHLKRCSQDTVTEEGQFARYCSQSLTRTIEKKNRKYPPCRQEIMCVVRRRMVHARFHFMDGQFRALEFDAATTTNEAINLVKDRIGLQQSAVGFSLFEVFGPLERNMLPEEKVADALFKWEKYARSTNSPKVLKLTFKKRIFKRPFANPRDSVEFNLLFHQAIDDVVSDRFPVTYDEAVNLAALRAHVTLGEYTHTINMTDYTSIIDRYIPRHLRQKARPEDLARKHKELVGMSEKKANEAYMEFVRQWPLYGSTIFDVLQGYTTTLPKNLWLAVSENGVHILKRRSKEPLVSYDYKSIVNYSPSLKNLMIVTESLTRGTKFVFNTSQASQIAHLIRDYTHLIVEKQRKVSLKRLV